MLIQKIIEEISNAIHAHGYISRVGGIVTPLPVDGGFLPVAICAPFSGDELKHMTPDDSETAVCFWEASPGRAMMAQTSTVIRLQNDLKLSLWVNTRRLSAAEQTDAELAIIRIAKNFQFDTEGSSIRAIEIEYHGDEGQGPQVLAKWAFDETEHRLTFPPYRVVAHKFLITYAVSLQCDWQANVINPAC